VKGSLEELLAEGDLDRYRSVVEQLAEEYDVLDIAAAAVRMVDEAGDGGETDDEEIPNVPVARDDRPRPERSRRPDRDAARGERNGGDEKPRRGKHRGGSDLARVFIGIGRKAGVRPGDLVGAIANEAGLDSRDIGAIEITDNFSLVEVPDDAADEVIRALRGTTIRGKKALARRDRDAKG
jgi:ATP-dependent RNA helicase DeaD